MAVGQPQGAAFRRGRALGWLGGDTVRRLPA